MPAREKYLRFKDQMEKVPLRAYLHLSMKTVRLFPSSVISISMGAAIVYADEVLKRDKRYLGLFLTLADTGKGLVFQVFH